MDRVSLPKNVFICPMPVTLVGAMADGRANFMPVSWVTRVNVQPAMLAVAMGKNHLTTAGVLERKAFSVSVPSRSMLVDTDYCGLVSGKKEDKSGVFSTFEGGQVGVPLIEGCPVTMACKLTQTVELPANYLFVGEIVEAWGLGACMTDGLLDPEKMEPFVLTMPDNNYWGLGEKVGKAWDAGRERS